ncbi:MAG: hypothetical protein JXA10_03185 [Anaerolineae bacterium]|nr:hypothetical protein [Anaerolineae bacterium]
MDIRIQYVEGDVAAVCALILRALPAWFGIEAANQHYIEYVAAHPTFVAYDDQHSDQGIGRALVRAAEDHLRAQDVRFLQVKTLSAKHPSPEYARTRAFYLGIGFAPLEEFSTLWDEANPCLQLIKAL